ncbi:MAG: TonB-dependent receptor [Methylotenera sp.]|uniref:TonB-dependent receptor family protein n=1 Tax=Methylotenera sp. TaxID=2051956 RepID=UPI0027239166|nr:TonB-dependent receptor [Methylotenera sp.]MDO9393973.1 TonB-dependent receptor [Methylotenera sp.]MDP1522415.1 TonB-dependent receptor [Methylotenera sp.]MDP3942367.1 TonB-dependent receptor [Methylotenera sp.]
MHLRKKIYIALLSALAVSHAQAESKAEAIELKAVTVIGILPEKLESVPGSFTVVDEKEMEAKRPFSVKEALSNVAGINIVTSEDPMSLALNIGVRGNDPRRSARTLLLEDGMPLFLAPYGDPAAHYSTPLDRVQRIEVVKGSGQVLYGPQTVGGMINFVTKPVPKDGFAGSVSATIGNNDFTGLHANLGYGNERGGMMIDVLQKKGDGVRKNHEFDVQDFAIKGQLNLTDQHTLIAKASYYEEDSNVSETGLGVTEYARDKFQAPSGKNDTFEHERKSFQLQHIFQIADKVKLSTQAYYVDAWRSSFRQTDEPGGFSGANNATGFSVLERCPQPAGTAFTEVQAANCGGRHRPRSYDYWGIEPRLDFSHNLFGIASDAVIGFRYHEEDIKREQYRGNTALFQNLSYAQDNSLPREKILIDVEAKSYYGQNTFYMGDWAVTPGIRVEDIKTKTDIQRANGNAHTNPQSKLTNKQTKVLPGFGVAWNGIDNTTIFAGVHKGFAPPRPSRDIFAAGANTAVAGETKPEESTNWEIGVRSKYVKGVSLESTLFHTKLDDIVINRGGGTYENAGETAMAGLELAGRVDFGTIYDTSHNVYVTASYTNMFTAEFKKTSPVASHGVVSGERLPYAPRHIASINLGYQHPVGVDARIGVDYISRQEPHPSQRVLAPVDAALSGLAGDIPSYSLLNASVSYKPADSKASYFISAHNLADKQYLVTRIDGMFAGRERQVFGGIRYDF